MDNTRTRARHRGALAAVVTTVLLAAGLTTVTAEPAAASTRFAGYRIPTTRLADSGWIGARKIGPGKVVYRIDPRRTNLDPGYTRARRIGDLNGRRGPTARRTHRAAYILAAFGKRRDPIQAAAVDAAVHHLLTGGQWRLGKARGRQRIAQPGANRTYVRDYARTMLNRSARYAGPYTRTLRASSAAVGSSTRVDFTIRSAAGYGLANLPVTFSFPGATAQTIYTSGAGRATAFFTVTRSGASTVTATVKRVAEHRLVVHKPRKAAASRVARAGVMRALRSAATIVSAGSQSVAVSNRISMIFVGQAADGWYTITGGTGARAIETALHGPFSTTSSNCATYRYLRGTTTVPGAGTYTLPSYKPAKSGYYRWLVNAAANTYTTAASTCGANVKVMKQATISQSRPSGRTQQIKIGKPFDVAVTIGGFDRSESHNIKSSLYGPFTYKANVNCNESRRMAGRDQVRAVTGNGTFDMGNVILGNPANAGWYVWRSTLANGDLIAGATSSCGIAYQVVP